MINTAPDIAEMQFACPLCDWQGPHLAAWQHGRQQHPAELPSRLTTLERLNLIPRLYAEVEATRYTPNPSESTARRLRIDSPASPVPLGGIVCLDSFSRVSNDPGAPLSLLVECSRICWDATPDEIHAAHQQPDGEPTLATEAAWLAGLWPDVQAWLDAADIAWIDEQTVDIVRLLAAAARINPPTRFRCPDCGASMHPAAGDWMLCEAGHWHPGPRRLRDEWRRKPPMPTTDLAEALHIPTSTIRRWHHEKRLIPARREGRQLWWLPWDVIRLRYPSITTEIDTAALPLASGA